MAKMSYPTIAVIVILVLGIVVIGGYYINKNIAGQAISISVEESIQRGGLFAQSYAGVDCSSYSDANSCNNAANCKWFGGRCTVDVGDFNYNGFSLGAIIESDTCSDTDGGADDNAAGTITASKTLDISKTGLPSNVVSMGVDFTLNDHCAGGSPSDILQEFACAKDIPSGSITSGTGLFPASYNGATQGSTILLLSKNCPGTCENGVCMPPACTPITPDCTDPVYYPDACSESALVDDGCGGAVSCTRTTTGNACTDAGGNPGTCQAGSCVCTPAADCTDPANYPSECSESASVPDGCGGTIPCTRVTEGISCDSGAGTCQAGSCVPNCVPDCTDPTIYADACDAGPVNDQCGNVNACTRTLVPDCTGAAYANECDNGPVLDSCGNTECLPLRNTNGASCNNGAGTCQAGSCVPIPSGMFVFVTSGTYTGNLGLTGADAKCQAEATAAGLPGTYTAWLSTSSVNAKDRVLDTAYKVTAGGAPIVVNNKADLTDGTLQRPINVDAQGITLGGSFIQVWTGTDLTGINLPNANCNDWTSAVNPTPGMTGQLSASPSWTQMRPNGCAIPSHLYCFQTS